MPLQFALTNEEFIRLTNHHHGLGAGGIVCFNGRVRRFNRDREVAFLYYESYIKLAKNLFFELENTVVSQFNVLKSEAVHRLDRVEVGQDAVSIVVFALHRFQAFRASEFLIDELKKNLPIWKKEVYVDGTHYFDQNCAACTASKARPS